MNFVSRLKKRWKSIVLFILLFYSTICVLLYFQQQRLIFAPSANIKETPSAYQLDYEDIWIDVLNEQKNQNEKIHGWWIPNDQDDSKVILYLHHNAINISVNITQALQFHELGYSIFLFDYRGFGKSKGDFPSESQVYEDAQAAWSYLTEQRQISPQEVVIYGHSIGGAIAIDLASQHPDAEALIVHNSFTSMKDMTQRFLLYRLFPVNFLLQQHFQSEDKIKFITIPKLIIASTKDLQIPVAMGEELYQAAPPPKQLLIIEGGSHDNHMSEKYLSYFQKFIDSLS